MGIAVEPIWRGEVFQLAWLLSSQHTVKFCLEPQPHFPISEVQTYRVRGAFAEIAVNFMGLVGYQGVLPDYYQSAWASALQDRGSALNNFLNLFQSRLFSLYYQAWLYTHPVLKYQVKFETDSLSNALQALSGLPKFPGLLHYAALLRQHSLSRHAIETVLKDYFRLPIRVQDFSGRWIQLPEKEWTRLAYGHCNQLGIDAVLGVRVHSPQQACDIYVGPVAQEKFYALLPDQPMAESLKKTLKLLLPLHARACVHIVLEAKSMPRLSLAINQPRRLGLDAWCLSACSKHNSMDVKYELE